MGDHWARLGTALWTASIFWGTTAFAVLDCYPEWSRLNGLEQVTNARHQDRPSFFEYAQRAFSDFKEIEVTGPEGKPLKSQALIVGTAKVHVPGGEPIEVMVIGQNRGRNTQDRIAADFGLTRPEGYEKAKQAMLLAEQRGMPVVTLIDTKGAHPSVRSEQENQSRAIADLLLVQRGLTVPHVAVVIGEGGSGGALALAQADRVLILQGAYYTVSTIETAASFLKQPKEKLADVADALHLTPPKLKELGIVDEVLAESPGFRLVERQPEGNTSTEPGREFTPRYEEGSNLVGLASVKEGVRRHLLDLLSKTPEQRKNDYYQRYRRIGQFEGDPTIEVRGLRLTDFDGQKVFGKDHAEQRPVEPVPPRPLPQFVSEPFVEKPFEPRRTLGQNAATRVNPEATPNVELARKWELHRKAEHERSEATRRRYHLARERQRREEYEAQARDYEQARAEYEAAKAAYPKALAEWEDNHRRTPRQWLTELLDSPEQFVELFSDLKPTDPLNFQVKPYRASIEKDQQKTGETEGVVTGIGSIDGNRVAVAVMNPYFRMATLGSVVGEKITLLTERARQEGIPLVILNASGGARMEEGPVSLMQMSKVSSAIKDFRDAGGLYISVLTDPTYGGVSASFANQAEISNIIGIKQARVGFTGPVAIKALEPGVRFPEGFQTSEYHLTHGNIGGVVAPGDLKKALAEKLAAGRP